MIDDERADGFVERNGKETPCGILPRRKGRGGGVARIVARRRGQGDART